MKIVYCIPSLYNSGGMERVLTQKANYFVEKFNYEVHIITSSQKDRAPFYNLSDKIRVHDINIDYENILKLPVGKRIVSRIKAKKLHKKRLSEILFKLKPDITVSMFTHETSFLPNINDGSKKIIELHFSKNFRKLDAKSNGRSRIIKFLNCFQNLFEHRSVKKYDKFVVLTEKDALAWGSHYSNIKVISNPSAFPVSNSIPPVEKRVLAVGRHCPQKGFDMLVDIWKLLPDHLKNDWHLDIFGDGPQKELLHKKIKKENLQDSIFLFPPTSDIKKEYLSHRIFCFPSRYEGFPLALMEAMSFSLPSIAFDCPCGPSDLIIDGQNGFLIAQNDLYSFAEKLSLLMENEEIYNNLSSSASYHIKSNFSEDRIMSKWQILFESLL